MVINSDHADHFCLINQSFQIWSTLVQSPKLNFGTGINYKLWY